MKLNINVKSKFKINEDIDFTRKGRVKNGSLRLAIH